MLKLWVVQFGYLISKWRNFSTYDSIKYYMHNVYVRNWEHHKIFTKQYIKI